MKNTNRTVTPVVDTTPPAINHNEPAWIARPAAARAFKVMQDRYESRHDPLSILTTSMLGNETEHEKCSGMKVCRGPAMQDPFSMGPLLL